jgi:ribosome assembly protein 1
MEGMAFFVERVDIDRESIKKEGRVGVVTFRAEERSLMLSTLEPNRVSQITGSLISAVKEACRSGLLDWSPRLKLAMYSCDIQTSSKHGRIQFPYEQM